MVSALDSGSGGPGSSPGRGHCVVFLGKSLYSHSASLHPGAQMGTSNELGVTLRWTSIPSRGGVASTMGHLGPYKGFNLLTITDSNNLNGILFVCLFLLKKDVLLYIYVIIPQTPTPSLLCLLT